MRKKSKLQKHDTNIAYTYPVIAVQCVMDLDDDGDDYYYYKL